jgi:hypothetical protein
MTPLGDDPRRLDANVKKLAGYEDRYRLRVGDYRVLYEVMDGQLVILVVGVGHRREIYRAMSLPGISADLDRQHTGAHRSRHPVRHQGLT